MVLVGGEIGAVNEGALLLVGRLASRLSSVVHSCRYCSAMIEKSAYVKASY